MLIYAGIDEAGYGPMFGPLLVGRMVLAVPALAPGDADAKNFYGPALWKRLSKAVCRDLSKRKGRIAVNDSKKLHTSKGRTSGGGSSAQSGGVESIDAVGGDASSIEAGDVEAAVAVVPDVINGHTELSLKHLEHLERGVLAFAALAGHRPANVCEWLDVLGETSHRNLAALPWYECSDVRPWGELPAASSDGELAVARGMLGTIAGKVGVTAVDLGAAVVFEDRFNQMVAVTRSKAAASFTFVAAHLRHVWDTFGEHHPIVVVDRQSGRMRYREPMALSFPDATFQVMEETPEVSSYRLHGSGASSHRAMTVRFEVEAESRHMPVALASMISKYTRELLMARFQSWFLHHAPHIRPTAGYATDARRFLNEIQPVLPTLAIDPARLIRTC